MFLSVYYVYRNQAGVSWFYYLSFHSIPDISEVFDMTTVNVQKKVEDKVFRNGCSRLTSEKLLPL